MPIPPHLARKFRDALGAEATEDVVSWMENVDSMRADVAELRHEMQLGFARLDSKMEAMFEKGLREQTRFFFLAWAVLLAAIIGIYAR